jgi:pimeloyl-ACP methyl ester carboxylesterase
LWGRHDRYIHLKYGQRMADLMADARLVILENCGHSSHEECPDTVNRLMVEFLK